MKLCSSTTISITFRKYILLVMTLRHHSPPKECDLDVGAVQDLEIGAAVHE